MDSRAPTSAGRRGSGSGGATELQPMGERSESETSDKRRRGNVEELATTMQRARRRVMCVGRVCECGCQCESGDE